MPSQTAWTVSPDDLKSGNAYRVNAILTQINSRISQLKTLQSALQAELNALGASATGASATLTTINVVPKLVAANKFGASSIVDDGTEVYTLEKLGVGTSTPGAQMAVVAIANPGVVLDTFGLTAGIRCRRADGTKAAPTPVAATNSIGSWGVGGWNGTAYIYAAVIQAEAVDTFSGTVSGAKLNFNVTLSGTTGNYIAAVLEDSGALLIGANPTDDGSGALLQVHGSVNLPAGQSYKVNGLTVIGYNGPTVQRTATPWLGTPTASRAVGTTYQNLTGASIYVLVTVSVAGASPTQFISDSSSTPSAVISEGQNAGGGVFNVGGWVLNGNYYKINAGSTLDFWTEWQ